MVKSKNYLLNFNMKNYSTQNVTPFLLEELKRAIESVPDYGSVKIFVLAGNVSQISIEKTIKTENPSKN